MDGHGDRVHGRVNGGFHDLRRAFQREQGTLQGSPTDELFGCGLGRKLSFQGYEIGAFRESVLVTASGEYGFLGNGSYMYINFNDEDFPREYVDCFLMGRGLGKCKYEIACIEHSVKPLVGRDGYGRCNVCYLHG